MDYNMLLEIAVSLGHRLAMCGAETFRVEESINRVLASYHIPSQVFAIPNCLTVSIQTEDGQSITSMRRIGYHGNDLDAVEKYSNLSRRICAEHPEPQLARQWLREADESRLSFKLPILLAGNFLGAFGFCMLFNGSVTDAFCSGFCGIIVGLINCFMDHLHANPFFRSITAAFIGSVPAYALRAAGIAGNPDSVIIGALMLLVPGLLFTNAMRDIIFGDTNSGVNRIVQVFLIAVAIALGTAAAWNVSALMFGVPPEINVIPNSCWVLGIACILACTGFAVLYNIHGPGGLLCTLGGLLTWGVYYLFLQLGYDDLVGFFWGTGTAAVYAESMARIRKYPAISYLVVSIFPLIPGAGAYYTMNYAVQGNMNMFAREGMHTLAIGGIMAVGILLVSTTVRLWSVWRRKHLLKK